MKSKFLITFMATVFIAVNAFSQKKCDCTITPYKPDPPCRSQCFAALLQTADTLEYRLILGFDAPLSAALYELKNKEKITDLDELKKRMSMEQFKNLTTTLDGLNDLQLRYFNVPFDKRKIIIAEWKSFDLNKRRV